MEREMCFFKILSSKEYNMEIATLKEPFFLAVLVTIMYRDDIIVLNVAFSR